VPPSLLAEDGITSARPMRRGGRRSKRHRLNLRARCTSFVTPGLCVVVCPPA